MVVTKVTIGIQAAVIGDDWISTEIGFSQTVEVHWKYADQNNSSAYKLSTFLREDNSTNDFNVSRYELRMMTAD